MSVVQGLIILYPPFISSRAVTHIFNVHGPIKKPGAIGPYPDRTKGCIMAKFDVNKRALRLFVLMHRPRQRNIIITSSLNGVVLKRCPVKLEWHIRLHAKPQEAVIGDRKIYCR